MIREAIRRAGSGRAGPVVVEIPRDVAAQTVSAWRSAPQRPVTSGPGPGVEAHLVAEAVKRLCSATRPVLYAGGGIVRSGCSKELVSLAEALDLPVAPTLMGLGCVPGDHRLCLGMLGMHGTYCANMAVAEADLLVAIGARFDDRVTGALEKFAPRAEIVHVDIDPSSIGAVVHPHLAIVADARRVLRHMLALLRVRKTAAGCGAERLDAWWARIAVWQRSAPLSYHASDAEIKPQRLCEELSRLADPEAIVTTDVGQHQMWLAQYYTFRKPRQLLTSGGLGTMGFGLPAAIGAAVAFPSRQVIAFVGDGGFQMTVQELSTAVQLRAEIKVVVVNNGCLGMVRQWQELFYDRAYLAVDMEHTPDFVALAEAYGATGFRVGHPRDVAAQLSRALAAPGVVVIDVRVCREENVYPMIPPGAGSSEMMLN